MNITQIKDTPDEIEYEVFSSQGLTLWVIRAIYLSAGNAYEIEINDKRGNSAKRFYEISVKYEPSERARLCKVKLEAIARSFLDKAAGEQLTLPFDIEETFEILRQKIRLTIGRKSFKCRNPLSDQ